MRLSWKSSNLRVIYNLQDDMGKGRCAMLFYSVSLNVIAWIAGNAFQTSFLLHNGINLVNIGIITFVPFIANCFAVFSPYILERFEKRRWILTASRAAYYTLYILAVTVVPPLIEDPSVKVAVFVALVFSANVINALFTSGYSVWHLNFIPNEMRAGYFSSVATISNFVGIGCSVIAALVADALAGSTYEYTVIVALRYIAYALGIAEVIILSLPIEFPYPHTSRPKITDIFMKPIHHKKFMLTMSIVFLYTIGANVAGGALNVYLLDTVGIPIAFIYFINFFYPIALMIFSRFAQRNIRRMGWLKSFAMYLLLQCPTTLAYACVNSANVWILMPIVRLIQHFLGATANVAYSNLLYINAPKEDQTNYIAFYTIVANLGAFAGMGLGTLFLKAFPDLNWSFLGLNFCNVQTLVLFWGLSELLVPLLTLFLAKKYDLEPKA